MFPYFLEKHLANPTYLFLFTSKWFFCYKFPVHVFGDPLIFLILVGGIGVRGNIKMVSASTPSANKPAKDLILVHTVQIKPMIKAQRSRNNGLKWHFDITFGLQVVESSSLVSLLFREAFNHPYIFFSIY